MSTDGPTSNWPTIIDQHVQWHRANEAPNWNKNLQYFLGKPWTSREGDSEAALIKTSTNFILPVVESALANLLAPNPQVTLNARTEVSIDQVEQGETIVNYALQKGRWRKELGRTVFHTVLYGRGPVKTGFDFDTDLPFTRFIDPRNYFFDRTAQRFEDMKYEIEATLLSKRQMMKKVEAGVYPSDALETAGAEAYPTWMIPNNKGREVKGLRDYQTWYIVYEVYDREAGMVLHYTPNRKAPIFTDALIFRPYDLLTFTYNGENESGVSEVSLIMPNQEESNWTETFLLNILRSNVPVTYYDKKLTAADKQEKMLAAPLGSRVGVDVPENRELQKMLYQPPFVQVPPMAGEMLARKREGIHYVSALSGGDRGQLVGAKTATEMEFVKQKLRDRLGPRIADIDELTERVAAKQHFLAQRYMKRERVVQLLGEKVWKKVNPFTLEGVDADFEIVAYNPMKMNPAVRIEAMRGMVPLLQGNPYVKQREFLAALFEDVQLGAADKFLYTDEEVAQRAQAAAQPPGAPPVAPPAPPTAAPPQSVATPLDPNPPPVDPGSTPPEGPPA